MVSRNARVVSSSGIGNGREADSSAATVAIVNSVSQHTAIDRTRSKYNKLMADGPMRALVMPRTTCKSESRAGGATTMVRRTSRVEEAGGGSGSGSGGAGQATSKRHPKAEAAA